MPHRSPVMVAFLVALLATSAALYAAPWWLDHGAARSPLALALAPEAADRMSGFAEVIVGVLGVAITVVAILVELAANRYTPRITALFVKDPVNVVVLGGFVVASVAIVWLEVTGWGSESRAMRLTSVGLLSAALLALLPYFAYVFEFLGPTRVIDTVRRRAAAALRAPGSDPTARAAARAEALDQLGQLGEMAQNALDNKDKAIAIAVVDALDAVLAEYATFKATLPADTFEPDDLLAADADLVAMHPDILVSVGRRRTWVEMKVFREFQAIFTESLGEHRDVAHIVAIRTRTRARALAKGGDTDALQLVLRFLNTYLRAAINARDVRTAYNLYNELRVVAEDLHELRLVGPLVETAMRMKFYGQLSFQLNLPFLLETAAYDLCTLLERVATSDPGPVHDALLEVFLDVDREPDSSEQEASLRGVRKAQLKLATWYLESGDVERARRIFDDMRAEPISRLVSIRGELEAVLEPDYWEVSDRGVHFDWMPIERRRRLAEFFSWFNSDEMR